MVLGSRRPLRRHELQWTSERTKRRDRTLSDNSSIRSLYQLSHALKPPIQVSHLAACRHSRRQCSALRPETLILTTPGQNLPKAFHNFTPSGPVWVRN